MWFLSLNFNLTLDLFSVFLYIFVSPFFFCLISHVLSLRFAKKCGKILSLSISQEFFCISVCGLSRNLLLCGMLHRCLITAAHLICYPMYSSLLGSLFYFLDCLWTIHSSIQGLFLAFCSQNDHSWKLQTTIWGARGLRQAAYLLFYHSGLFVVFLSRWSFC